MTWLPDVQASTYEKWRSGSRHDTQVSLERETRNDYLKTKV